MLKNENIICISSIDWDFIWQGHQEIMTTLAVNGNRVLFIENTGVRAPGIKDIPRIKSRVRNWFKGIKGIRKEKDNLYIFSPLVLPFPYSRIARWINRRLILHILEKWIKVMDFSDSIVWTFLPTGLSLDLLDNLDKKLCIYYCLDNFKAVSFSTRKIEKYEVEVIKKSDIVFVTSDSLYNKCLRYNNRVYKFPFTASIDKFDKNKLDVLQPPDDIKNIKRPIIGFSGGVRGLIDRGLIKYLADSNPDYSFVFVGPLQMDIREFSIFKNVHFLGQKSHDVLPQYINHFDITIIPYILNDFSRSIFPAKLNEYLVLGKPVVATNLPELVNLQKRCGDIIYIADTMEEFNRAIKKGLSGSDEINAEKRIEFVRNNSWKGYIEKMSALIEGEIQSKKMDIEKRWKENFINFCRIARRRTTRLAVISALIYILFFKTPFIWLLSSPLRMSDAPQEVDAIVVFGGGVGETGSPGKSTIERARYAAELYKRGYADKIIFSSGYTYIYNDAENMKLLAVSMGIPSDNIILEQKANSTYENVRFSKEILDRHGWDSILLVSSPYNMRRTYLVFNKWGGNTKVFYLPVKESQFYDRSEGIRIEQIKAITHEYLGIGYYWLKRYI